VSVWQQKQVRVYVGKNKLSGKPMLFQPPVFDANIEAREIWLPAVIVR